MDLINLLKSIDIGKGNYILILLNEKYLNANFGELLKFETYQTHSVNIITFDSIFNDNTIIQLLSNSGLKRDVDYILWCKKYFYKSNFFNFSI